MDPDRSIRTTAAGRRAAAARDGRLKRGQDPTRPLMLASERAPMLPAGIATRPWTVVHRAGGSVAIADWNGRVVAEVAQAEAAPVLAAAADMLAALQDVIRMAGSGDHSRLDIQHAAQAALAKAGVRS